MGECGRNSVLCLFMQQSESVQVHLWIALSTPLYYVQLFIQGMRHPKDSVSNFINIARFARKVQVSKFSSTLQQIESGYSINRNRLI